MPDPIPRNRSARHRRPRRFAGPKSWRVRPFRRGHDNPGEAEPAVPQQCTVVGQPVYLDQPQVGTHEDAAPAPPLQPVTSPLAPRQPLPPPSPQPVSPQPASPIASPLRRTQDNTEPEQPAPPQPLPPQPPPPRPRPPATRRDRPHRRVRLNAGPPRPPRLRRPRPASTDVLVGGSLLAGVALVMGLVLPLLPLGASANSTATPPVSDRGGGSAVAPEVRDPDPVSEPPAVQPGAVHEVDHSPPRDGVALLADRSAARPDIPVTVNQPPPAQVPPPADVGNGRPVDPVAVDQGRQDTGRGQPDPGQRSPQPVPPSRPDTRPNPPPGPTPEQRKQLEQFAKQLAALKQNSGGSPKPPTGPGTLNGTRSNGQRVKAPSVSRNASPGSKSKASGSSGGGSGPSGGGSGSSN
jgi:hypothetical protein